MEGWPEGIRGTEMVLSCCCVLQHECVKQGLLPPQLTLPEACLHLEEQLWFSFLVSDGKGVTSVNKPQKS